MSARSLTIAFCFSLLLIVVSMLAPMYASAQNCCPCGRCWMKLYTNPPCNCPGENGCGTCLSDESDPFQVSGVTHKEMDANAVPVFLASPISKLDATARVMDLLKGGMCFRERVALGLLGNSRDSLKFEPLRFDGEQLSALHRGTQN